MKRASTLFNPGEIAAIEQAIGDAERQTAGEIVPVVASSSGRYDRAEDLFGLCFALASLAAAWILLTRIDGDDWSSPSSAGLSLGIALLVVLGGFLVGTAAASRLTLLRLPFITRGEMLEEVERSARETFQRERLRATANGTGILIYVSLYEHLVKVIADDQVSEHLPNTALEEICAEVVDGLKRNEPAAGLQRAIQKTGEILQPALPAAAENQLPNHLVLID